MRIFDCFPFFNEFELLRIRLHELSPFVSKFLLVEAPESFTGNPKPLWFKERAGEFAEFSSQIVATVSAPAVNPRDPWDRESNQRNWLSRMLTDVGVEENDLILSCDVDEIPRGQDFEALWDRPRRKKPFMQFWMDQYYFFMNLKGSRAWPGSVVISAKSFAENYKNDHHVLRIGRRHGDVVRTGGWHFSFMGGIEKAILKYKSYSHFGQTTDEMRDPKALAKWINQGIIPTFHRGHIQCEWTKINDTYPKWLVENYEEFRNLFREVHV
jgi:beta-1,4-mannosyl-glycoprotein beta-1,4-N-acetylglucosaminyltransferase